MRIISVYPNFGNKGGAQNVALQLAKELNNGNRSIVLCETPTSNIVEDYKQEVDYLPFSIRTIRNLANQETLFLSHHRKNTLMLMLCKRLFPNKHIHVIHVAHNTFNNLRWCALFPKHVIAVSNGVKENLVNYFHVPENHIHVIFNGMKDTANTLHERRDDEIRIIIPGRICPVKRQVEIVKHTKAKLSSHIHIYFAGVGEDQDLLQKEMEGFPQYHFIGYVNMSEVLSGFDYVCLFSEKEGLSLSLIEGLMFRKPLVTNKVQALLDVNQAGETGFAYDGFDELVEGINNLPMPSSALYQQISRKARKRYEEHFTENRMISMYKNIIQQEMEHLQITPPPIFNVY